MKVFGKNTLNLYRLKVTHSSPDEEYIGRPVLDKGTSVITFTATTTTAAMFPNADDHLGNWVENPSQYN